MTSNAIEFHGNVVDNDTESCYNFQIKWFTGMQTKVGIVRTENNQYFIGAARTDDDELNIEIIAKWGAAFPTDVGNFLFSKGDKN